MGKIQSAACFWVWLNSKSPPKVIISFRTTLWFKLNAMQYPTPRICHPVICSTFFPDFGPVCRDSVKLLLVEYGKHPSPGFAVLPFMQDIPVSVKNRKVLIHLIDSGVFLPIQQASRCFNS